MKVGDYVRTKDGIILKIEETHDIYTTDNEFMLMVLYDKDGHFVNDIEVIKSSPNIIDLIQERDLVKYNPMMNGYIKKQTFCKMIKDIKDLLYFKYQIEHRKANFVSIVTKEQFESMEYEVK